MIKTLFLAPCLLLMQMATAQTCNDAIPANTPDGRFVVDGGEVTDTKTGLVWQSCSLGQMASDCSGTANTYDWQEALQAAEANALWRLPNINELRSILEEKCDSPAINLTIFPNTISSYYWSASPFANGVGASWYVDFSGGKLSWVQNSGSYHVRLVRGGQ